MLDSSWTTRIIGGVAAAVCSATFLLAPAASRASEDASVDEAAYLASVRSTLDAGKRAPTGREASLAQPSGTTAIWFDVSNAGKVVASGIAESSHSQLLDVQARTLVDRARFTPFPDRAFDDAATHRFVVRYAFNDPRGSVAVGPLQLANR